jgi:hypothetical protein
MKIIKQPRKCDHVKFVDFYKNQLLSEYELIGFRFCKADSKTGQLTCYKRSGSVYIRMGRWYVERWQYWRKLPRKKST